MTRGLGYCYTSSFDTVLIHCDILLRALDKKGLTFSKTCNMSRRRLPASVEGVVLVGAAAAMLVSPVLYMSDGWVRLCDGWWWGAEAIFVDTDAYAGGRKTDHHLLRAASMTRHDSRLMHTSYTHR